MYRMASFKTKNPIKIDEKETINTIEIKKNLSSDSPWLKKTIGVNISNAAIPSMIKTYPTILVIIEASLKNNFSGGNIHAYPVDTYSSKS
ncbi:MAG: hypothetical protein PF482_04715 [Desulfobacteraceae bacterium]|jgi:hypothetical protein|nr:hypothetical protein [Desulfobacteraceae bacterium]